MAGLQEGIDVDGLGDPWPEDGKPAYGLMLSNQWDTAAFSAALESQTTVRLSVRGDQDLALYLLVQFGHGGEIRPGVPFQH